MHARGLRTVVFQPFYSAHTRAMVAVVGGPVDGVSADAE
jgi:hypothetical protein